MLIHVSDFPPNAGIRMFNEPIVRCRINLTSFVRQRIFDAEARGWPHIQVAVRSGVLSDPKEHLYFVAYFDREPTRPNKSE